MQSYRAIRSERVMQSLHQLVATSARKINLKGVDTATAEGYIFLLSNRAF